MSLLREGMDSALVIQSFDISTWISPIEGDSPTGQDIRQNPSSLSSYYQIKDARNQARTLERQQSQGVTTASAKPLWENVVKLAEHILLKESKDLEICAWLIEALIRLEGFVGLRNGFLFTFQLCTEYWDNLFPHSNDDLYYKVAAFAGLNGEDSDGTLIIPIYSVPLTEGQTAGPFSKWQYQQALDLSHMTDADKQVKRIAQGAVTLSNIETAVLETNVNFFRQRYAELTACQKAYQQLSNFFDEKCGTDSPPSSRIKSALADCLDCLQAIAGNILNDTIGATNETNSDDSLSFTQKKNQLFSLGTELNRDLAFEALGEIANYFRRTEPHSPLSYLIQKTIYWGRLSLPQLLSEIIKDDNMRQELFTLTGIDAT